MSDAKVLDFDALVRKHVLIVPSCRNCQLPSWVLLSLGLFILAAFALAIVFDFLWFGKLSLDKSYDLTQVSPILDFPTVAVSTNCWLSFLGRHIVLLPYAGPTLVLQNLRQIGFEIFR